MSVITKAKKLNSEIKFFPKINKNNFKKMADHDRPVGQKYPASDFRGGPNEGTR